MEAFKIEIPTWGEYNPRVDRTGYSWFRMQNAFFQTMRVKKGYSGDAAHLMVVLLCERSGAKGPVMTLRLKFLADMIDRTQKATLAALHELVAGGDAHLDSLDAASRALDGSYARTDRQTDKDNRQTDERRSRAGLPRLAELWNQGCGELAGVVACGDGRRKHADARLAEKPDEAYWASVVAKIAASSFCNGKTDRGTWQADFDWFVKPETHLRVMEGKYDDRKAGGAKPDLEAVAKQADREIAEGKAKAQAEIDKLFGGGAA